MNFINKNTLVMLAGLLLTISHTAHADVTFVHTDHLGTPVAYSDGTGAVIGEEATTPYGESLNPPTSDDLPAYTGHVRDGSTGLVYMQARYYDPVVGRFLSTDPVGFESGGTGYFNRYSYVSNNPTGRTDPTGAINIDPWSDFVNCAGDHECNFKKEGDGGGDEGGESSTISTRTLNKVVEKAKELEPEKIGNEAGVQVEIHPDGSYTVHTLRCGTNQCHPLSLNNPSVIVHLHPELVVSSNMQAREVEEAYTKWARNHLPSSGDINVAAGTTGSGTAPIPVVTVGTNGMITLLQLRGSSLHIQHLGGPESPFWKTFKQNPQRGPANIRREVDSFVREKMWDDGYRVR